MGRLILLPFRVRPDVPDLPAAIVPMMPVEPPASGTTATRDDVIRLYRQYLQRDPENEGAITGRTGRSLLEVEVEIATSDEALEVILRALPQPRPSYPPQSARGVSEWGKRAGLLIADALARELAMTAAPPGAWIVFAVQADREDARGTSAGGNANNPLNLSDAQGAIKWAGVSGRYAAEGTTYPAFVTLDAGAAAAARNYAAPTYADVQAAFRSGDLLALARAIQASPWAANHYGGTLVSEVEQALA